MDNNGAGMARYWDDRARENSVWYVDTTCDYQNPDMAAFFATGRRIVAEALLDAPIRPTGRHLAVEIGPGLGRVAVALADHFDRVIGVDVSEQMVTQARQLTDTPKVIYEVGSGADLAPVETASADFVVTFTVLQHLPSPRLIEGYLREAARVLKPGGVLAAQWNNQPKPSLWKARVRWWQVRRRLGPFLPTDIRVRPEFAGTRFPFVRVRRTLEDAGMTIRDTRGLGTLFAWVWAEKTEVLSER